MVSFLETEREKAGWRFLLLWLIATNLGFLLGLSIEFLLFEQANFYFAVPLAALLQGWVINRHISIYLPWAIGTSLFWIVGALIAFQILNAMQNNDLGVAGSDLTEIVIRLMLVSAVAGLFAGIPQWFFMRDWLKGVGIWWLGVSALAWAILLPGLITGLVLMQQVTKDKIPLKGRRYQLSGEF